MKLRSIMWNSHVPMLVQASKKVDFLDLKIFSTKTLENDPLKAEEALLELKESEIILIYRSSESFWDTIEARLKEIGKKVPIVCVSHDPSFWYLSTVLPEVVSTCYSYITLGGEENFVNMLRYLANKVKGVEVYFESPKKVPWEGLYHPDAPNFFTSVDEYLKWYKSRIESRKSKIENRNTVGILFSRHYWVNNNLEVEDVLIEELEKRELNVIPAFSYSVKDDGLGAKGSGQVIKEFFLEKEGKPRIDALIKLQSFFLGNTRGDNLSDTRGAISGVEILKEVDVPVFQPIISYYKSVEEWEEDSQGLGSDISWSVAMPEFEGVIEPIIIGAAKRKEDRETSTIVEQRTAIRERCRRLVGRVKKWIELKRKPTSERKVAFILHNNPCASVEATVGGGAHLDTLESVARIMNTMKEKGYAVEPPKDGKELIETIMKRKAISEFRWTTVDEIVKKGGILSLVSLDEYLCWWETFPERVKKRVSEVWGNPPGEEVNGVPAAMVYENKILVTGISYGNTVVCVQPKRGCAGPRCDGRVCKILHDPDVPPPHQYLATYRYLEDVFRADVIVHVGTHGNLEFLPGKGVGLSEACLPDLSIHELPHLYIYNADNPPEGTIAKRRSYATLVDHMQTVMTQGGLYEELEELGRYLGEYEQAKISDKGRAHELEHIIIDLIKKTNLDKEIKLKDDIPFSEVAKRAHETLSRIRNTQIQEGMHIFGVLPEGEKRVDFINSILRYDSGVENSPRKFICRLMGLKLDDLLKNQGAINPHYHKSQGELLEEIDFLSKVFIREVLASGDGDLKERCQEIMGERLKDKSHLKKLDLIKERIMELNSRIEATKEIEALLHGFEGGYIPAGPSGLITRGRDDVLPTGRNFYSLDPKRVPTKAAYKVGEKLARAVIEKHQKEEGRVPENVAIYWMCSDIMWSDGEGMGQIMYLLGVRPLWLSNGQVKGFEIIPLEELRRPRIDVTIRVSGITRDNFPNCIELVDEAVQAVASLDEPKEMNFVRKHALEQIESNGEDASDRKSWRNATLRLFASKPGTYGAGVNLAVYASAWKDEHDLSDVFVYWNGYAYGKGVFGQESHRELINNLRTVDVTFNKVVSDEYDLFGCCCYFGTHGGMTTAARAISGKEISAYYGDTREPEHVEVRNLADEVRRVVRTKLLNPKWIEGMKRHGYKGAGDISKRVGRVYGWEATTNEVDDWIFDDITRTFILNEENRKFFEEHNPWALEEIGRRLLEAESRGLWHADPEVLAGLKDVYLEIEGWIEEKMGDVEGDFQGGSVDILTSEDVENWGEMMSGIKRKLERT
ncbi:MAG: cobalt chelatase [Deltaproteobacteria bacterium]|nr:MAG: cobalt chelatase [Deltaproteobacteria bacterium]